MSFWSNLKDRLTNKRVSDLPKSGTVSRGFIRSLFPHTNPDVIFIPDRDYYLPSYPVLQKIMAEVGSFIHANQLYYFDQYDCDNQASTFNLVAAMYYYHHTKLAYPEGIAIGMVSYTPSARNPHAINFAVMPDSSITWIEPQNQEFITDLVRGELERIQFMKMA